MHRDSTAPEVGVELWIRGGSREEAPGHFGTAHLFEHHVPSSPRFPGNAENQALLQRVSRGANAGTEPDILNLYRRAAPEGLEVALAYMAARLESDSTAFTADRLARDQGIVVAELEGARGLLDPAIRNRILSGIFGPDHPYGHSDTVEGVRAATPELMREWRRRFAVPANAVLFVMGRFDPEEAEDLVRRHFAGLPPGLPVPKPVEWVPRPRALTESMEGREARGTVVLGWPVPGWGSETGDHLTLLADVLEDRIRARTAEPVLDPFVQLDLWEVAGAFRFGSRFESGADPAEVERTLRAVLEELIREGPSEAELEAARARAHTTLVRHAESLVWRDSRTALLGRGLMSRGDPGYYRTRLRRLTDATARQVRATAEPWLGPDAYVLRVLPRVERTTAPSTDRAPVIASPPVEPLRYPTVRDTTLDNRLRFLSVEATTLPLTRLTFAVRGGSGTDEPDRPGRAWMAAHLIPLLTPEGEDRTLAELFAATGASVEVDVDDELILLHVDALDIHAPSLIRGIASALRGDIPEGAVEDVKADALARLAAVEDDPVAHGVSLALCRSGGEPACRDGGIEGLGDAAAVEAVSGASLADHLRAAFVGSGMTVTAVGSRSVRELAVPLEAFPRGDEAAVPSPAAGMLAGATTSGSGHRFVVVDDPGETQVQIFLAQRLPAEARSDPLMAQLMTIWVRERITDDIRRSRGWAYELWPYGLSLREDGGWFYYRIPVTRDRAGDAIVQILADLRSLREDLLPEARVSARVRSFANYDIGRALGSPDVMRDHLVDVARGVLPPDHYSRALARLGSLTPDDVREAARAFLAVDAMAWVLVGDRSTVEAELAEAGISDWEIREEP